MLHLSRTLGWKDDVEKDLVFIYECEDVWRLSKRHKVSYKSSHMASSHPRGTGILFFHQKQSVKGMTTDHKGQEDAWEQIKLIV